MEQVPAPAQQNQTWLKPGAIAAHGPAQSPVSSMSYQYTPQQGGYFPPKPQPTSQPARKSFLSSFFWWWPELLASLVSLASFASIIAIARHYRGHGIQDDGLPTGLTLNGLIALFATIARAALLIPIASTLSQEAWLWLANGRRTQLRDLEVSDDASRGAWGSFLLLRHFRRSWLAYMAAIVTIVSLLFGTFTQQLLTIKTFPVNDSALNPGNVPWSNSWTNWTGRPSEGPSSPPLLLKAAAYNGILTNNGQPSPTTCRTGNCSWPITPSVAICGGCVNSTFTLTCNSSTSTLDSAGPSLCAYELPSGMTANLTNLGFVGEGIGFQVFQSPGSYYKQGQSDKVYLANFEAVGMPAGTENSDWSWQNKSAVAYECALWGCIQAFETWQVNSNQTQVVRHSWDKVDDANITDLSSNSEEGIFSNITFVDVPKEMNAPSGTSFTFLGMAVIALNTYFNTLFNGNITVNQGTQLSTSDVVQALQNSTSDLDSWMQNVASSLTNVVRSYDQVPQRAALDGTGFQLGYDVRWPWIILPALLVGTSLLLLAIIMIRTASSDIHPWKGSPLTMLFMNVDYNTAARANGQIDRYNGIENSVGKSEVSLKRDANGLWGIKQM